MGKGIKILITVLILLVLSLGGYLIYDKFISDKDVTTVDKKEEQTENETVESKENETVVNHTYKNITGLYTATSQDEKNNFQLYLWEDGTFTYIMRNQTFNAVGGNYTIVDNTIKLNYLVWEGNGAGLGNNSGSNVLKINDDNSLTNDFSDEQAKNSISNSSVDSITLIKSNSTEETEFLSQNNSLTSKIEQYGIHSPNA